MPRFIPASSSWWSPKSNRPPFEWTTGKSLLWYPLRIVLMEGHISHSSRVLRRCHLEKSSCFFKFGCRSFTKHTPWSVCFLIAMWKKLACFYELQIGRISINISLPDSVLETKKLQAKVWNSICRIVSVCELLQIVNYDGLTFLTALVLFN